MFDFVTKHKRLLQVFLGLAMIPFAFFGLEAYTRSTAGADQVAVVNGVPITNREFSEEMRRQQDRMNRAFGGRLDPAQLDTPAMRLAVLEGLVSQRAVLDTIADERLTLSREAVVDSILAAPDFQVDGKFSSERYQAYLRERGVPDEVNVQRLRVELPAARLANAISSTAFLPRSVVERMAALESQKREVQEALVPAEPFVAQVKVDDAKAKAYYDGNPAEFRVAERIRAQYVVLSAEELGKQEPVSEEELAKAYEARASQLGVAEARRASHILVASKEEADKLLAEAKKNPKAFGELAKQHSQDTDSAPKGGDLGDVTPGSLASKALEDVIFKLKPGELGGPVQSEFGFHVVQLTGIKAGKVKPLAEMKDELTAEIARQKGARKFSELAEPFNNLAYEQSDSLKPLVEKYKVRLQESGWFSREQPTPEIGPLAHPKLLAGLFSADSLQQKRNTDAVEVAPGILVAARVLEHQPATQRAFEEAKPQILQRLARREAQALARKEGEARLAELAKGSNAGGEAGLKWSPAKQVSRREPQGLPAEALRKVLTADAAKLPAYVGADRGEQGYGIYRVTKVIAEPLKAEQTTALAERLAQGAGAEQFDAYIAGLRAKAKIVINQANLERK